MVVIQYSLTACTFYKGDLTGQYDTPANRAVQSTSDPREIEDWDWNMD